MIDTFIKGKHTPAAQSFVDGITPVDGSMFNYKYSDRHGYIGRFGWFPVSWSEVKKMAKMMRGRKVIDVGAGTGFLAHLLKHQGIFSIRAVDSFEKYAIKVKRFDIVERVRDAAVEPLHMYEDIIMSWPPYGDDFAFNIANKMVSGQRLFYRGEWWHGCTANDKFFEEVERNFVKDEGLTDELNRYILTRDDNRDDWQVLIKK